MQNLTLKSARVISDAYPCLVLTFADGAQACVIYEQKVLGFAPYVFLGADWERKLPPIKLPADDADGRAPMTLNGFTGDATIVRLARQFLQDLRNGKLKSGPVAIA
jgi:hypothetical protein